MPERLGDREAFRIGKRIDAEVAEGELLGPDRVRRAGHHLHAVVHQQFVASMRPIPLDHRELGMVQRPALPIAEDAGELDDAALAGRQQLLAGEFRRGPQVALVARAGLLQLGPEAVEMGLVARRNLQHRGLDLDELGRGEEFAQIPGDRRPRQQKWPAVGMDMQSPERGMRNHQSLPS